MTAKSKTSILGIKPTKLTELLGWYGMTALIVAYFLVSFELVDAQSLVYQLINITAGIGLLIVAASKGVKQLVILNVFWAVIGIVAIARVFIA